MSNPSQLYLLADHIKLSLLERQRAISLNLEPTTQDGNISRSLESMQEGIEAVDAEAARLKSTEDSFRSAANLEEQASRLRTQYHDLESQFRGFPTDSTTSSLKPNDPSLKSDFDQAKDLPRSQSSLRRGRDASGALPSPNPSKSVRFSDNPRNASSATPEIDAQEQANRAALFPYRDEPENNGPPDQSNLDNQHIHEYHRNVLQDQDEQLDRLGVSIGRQRDLSIQIGDELDDHVQMLDEVDYHVDRHQTRLDGARKNLGNIARKAKDNKQLTTILCLIIILVLLIIILK
ncbi:hypothetical protein MMC25_004976 [Agyrium rufum]|nr:hypothetical protein [Agyrium rufum]